TDLLDPFVDRFLLAFDERLDRAVAVVLDPTLQTHTPRHTRGVKAVADSLDLAVDSQMPLFLHRWRIVSDRIVTGDGAWASWPEPFSSASLSASLSPAQVSEREVERSQERAALSSAPRCSFGSLRSSSSAARSAWSRRRWRGPGRCALSCRAPARPRSPRQQHRCAGIAARFAAAFA